MEGNSTCVQRSCLQLVQQLRACRVKRCTGTTHKSQEDWLTRQYLTPTLPRQALSGSVCVSDVLATPKVKIFVHQIESGVYNMCVHSHCVQSFVPWPLPQASLDSIVSESRIEAATRTICFDGAKRCRKQIRGRSVLEIKMGSVIPWALWRCSPVRCPPFKNS